MIGKITILAAAERSESAVGNFIQKYPMLTWVLLLLSVLGLFSLYVLWLMSRKKKFNAYLAESLSDHLEDKLNAGRYSKSKLFDINTYMYGCLVKYATDHALVGMTKKQTYNTDGSYTDKALKKIADEEKLVFGAFTNKTKTLADKYCEFIRENMTDAKVEDFDDSLDKYMLFLRDASIYRASQNSVKTANESSINFGIGKKDSKPVIQDETASKFAAVDTPMPKRKHFVIEPGDTVSKDMTDAVMAHAKRMASNHCDKRFITKQNEDGTDTDAYKQIIRNAYNKIYSVIGTGRNYKPEFVEWVNSEPGLFPDDLTDVITRYLKFRKNNK